MLEFLALPLTGGTVAVCSIAANKQYIFIGTNQSPAAVKIVKSSLQITQVGGGSPPITVSSITADDYGYVTVSFGSFAESADNAFYVFDPDGELQEDGGGAAFVLNSLSGLSTATLPTSDPVPASRLVTRLRSAKQAPEPIGP